MAGKAIKAPLCAHCLTPAAVVSGVDVYPHRPDLGHKWFWRCGRCPDAYVGCHGITKRPLGRPANAELRKARGILHDQRVDPLWKTALVTVDYQPEDPKARAIILNTARARVYEFIAWKMGLDRDECHVAMFTLPQCRAAWTALAGVDYPFIRRWAKLRKERAAA